MEKLNIAEHLKDCAKGTKLYSPLFGDVLFEKVINNMIYINTEKEYIFSFDKYGRYKEYTNSECLLFPSKENRDWSTFQRPFKDGDVVFYNDTITIFKEWGDETLFKTYATKYLCCDSLIDINVPLFGISVRKEARFATEEEKEKLFKAIKDNGYNWNPETKTLEKLIEQKFKVGDKIKLKNTPTNNILTVTKTNDDGSLNVNMYSWVIEYELQDEYELAHNNQPKFEVGDKIKKKGDTRLITIKDVRDSYYIITFLDDFGHCYVTDKLSFSKQDDYELLPNKFNITTLKPFDKVLVRGNVGQKWIIDFFGFMDRGYPFVCVGHRISQCIPYEQNEHLLNTTNDCDEYYKTWE